MTGIICVLKTQNLDLTIRIIDNINSETDRHYAQSFGSHRTESASIINTISLMLHEEIIAVYFKNN
jgi:hypothetical protein